MKKEQSKQNDGVEEGHDPQVGCGNCEDVAKKVGVQVRRITGFEPNEEYTKRHAHGPEDANGCVGCDATAAADQPNAECRDDAEGNGNKYGVDTEEITQADTAKCRMRDATADENEALDDDVGAHDAASDADEHSGDEGVLDEGVL